MCAGLNKEVMKDNNKLNMLKNLEDIQRDWMISGRFISHRDIVECLYEIVSIYGGQVLPAYESNEVGFIWFKIIDGEEIVINPTISKALCGEIEQDPSYNGEIANQLCAGSISGVEDDEPIGDRLGVEDDSNNITTEHLLGLLKHRLVNTRFKNTENEAVIYTDEELYAYLELAGYEYDLPYAIVSKAYCLAIMTQIPIMEGQAHNVIDNGVVLMAPNIAGRLVELLGAEMMFLKDTPKKTNQVSAKAKEDILKDNEYWLPKINKEIGAQIEESKKVIGEDIVSERMRSFINHINRLESSNFKSIDEEKPELTLCGPPPAKIETKTEASQDSNWAIAGAALLAAAAVGALAGKDAVGEQVKMEKAAEVYV